MGDWERHKPIKIEEHAGSSKKGVLDFGPLERRLTSFRRNRMPMPEPKPVAAPEAQPLPVAVVAPEAQPQPLPVASPEAQPQPLPVAAPEAQPLPPHNHTLDREHAEQEEQPAHKHAKRDEPLDRERAERDELLDRERVEREVQPAQKHGERDEPLDRERAEREVPPEQGGDCYLPRFPSPGALREAPSGSGLFDDSCSDMEISEDDAADPLAEGATERQVRTVYLRYSEIPSGKKDSGPEGDNSSAEGVMERQVRWTWRDPAASHPSSSHRRPPTLPGGGAQEARAYSSPYEVFDFQSQALTFRDDNISVLGADANDESLEFSDDADDD